MRRAVTVLAVLVGVVPALGVMTSVAEAHHLENDTSTIACVLVNNVPTLQVHAQYRDFTKGDLPVYVTTTVDGAVIPGGSYAITEQTATSPDFTDDKSYPLSPGAHDVAYDAKWAHGYGGISATVVCPPPVQPPVMCNGVPVPPGTNCVPPPPVVVCNGVTMPPGTPVTSCVKKPRKPPARVKKYHCPVIYLVKPSPRTQAGRHGVHAFGGRCSRGKIISVTLAITPVSPGRAVSMTGTVHLHARGGIIHGVWLYDLSVWRHRYAWGRYRLKYTFKVRYHGHTFICVRKGTFFNYDTKGLPD
jgi:hypothetical protein